MAEDGKYQQRNSFNIKTAEVLEVLYLLKKKKKKFYD